MEHLWFAYSASRATIEDEAHWGNEIGVAPVIFVEDSVYVCFFCLSLFSCSKLSGICYGFHMCLLNFALHFDFASVGSRSGGAIEVLDLALSIDLGTSCRFLVLVFARLLTCEFRHFLTLLSIIDTRILMFDYPSPVLFLSCLRIQELAFHSLYLDMVACGRVVMFSPSLTG